MSVTSLLLVVLLAAAGDPAAEDAAENSRSPKSDADLRLWLENMVWRHRFTSAEIRAATGLSETDVEAALRRFDIRPENAPPRDPQGPLLVLPYPGGRHPRIGFLDGAVRPQRETKVSVFTPWDATAYVVADVPEAIWTETDGKRELLYLAHTHVPTRWTRQGIELKPQEWRRGKEGVLSSERRLPNNVAFRVEIRPTRDAVRMTMELTNGSKETLRGLRAQNCVLFKGTPEFAAQSNENKTFRDPYVACRSSEGPRWVIAAWEGCQRAWGNPLCPCMHSDPQFPDCAPGETQRLRGWLSFYEGEDIEGELRRIEGIGWRR